MKLQEITDYEVFTQENAYNFTNLSTAAAFNGELIKLKFCNEVLHNFSSSDALAHAAVEGGQLEFLRYLVKEGKCHPGLLVNETSLLHIAALNGCLPIIKYLIEELKINPLLENSQNKTPLHNACRNGNIEVVEYIMNQAELHDHAYAIVKSRTKLGSTILHFASASGNVKLLQHFLPKYSLDPNFPGQFGATPLLVAAQEGHLNIIQYLVRLKSCNVQCYLKSTNQNAAHISAHKGHLHIIQFLKEQLNFDLSKKDSAGYTSLHFASLYGHISVVKYLVTHCKCSVLELTKKRRTPLHLAAENGHTNVLKFLTFQLDFVDPLCKHLNALTPLDIAVRFGRLNVVQFYVNELNIDLLTPDRFGDRLLFKAVHYGMLEIVQILMNKLGVWTKVCSGPRQNRLLLHCIKRGQLEILKYFIVECSWAFIPLFCDEVQSSLLHVAAHEGKLNIVKFLINNLKKIPSITDGASNTPLHRACQNGHLEVVKFLVEKCSLLQKNPQNYRGITPFHLAAVLGHYDVADYLIQCGVSPDCTDKYGLTALHYAAITGRLDSLKFLIGKTPTRIFKYDTLFEKNSLHLAAFHGHLHIVKYLVSESGMDPNISDLDYPRATALLIACQQHHRDIVKFLLSCPNINKNCCSMDGYQPLHFSILTKENINFIDFLIRELSYDPMCVDFAGNTPLHLAANMGKLLIFQYFVDTIKINPNITNKNGQTSLHLASQKGYVNIVKFLAVTKKCDIMCRENYGNIPAFYSITYEHFKIIKLFIELGVDPLTPGDARLTLIHEAARIGNIQIWNLLMSVVHKKNALYNTGNESGKTPLHIACMSGHIFIAKQILEDFRYTKLPVDDDFRSPLHFAVFYNQLEIVKFLTMEKGYDPLLPDCDDMTPLHIAAKKDHTEIVNFYRKQLGHELSYNHLINNNGLTPKYYFTHIFMEEGDAEIGQTILHIAAEGGKLSFIKSHLQTLCFKKPNVRDQLGRTPLHYAAMKDKILTAQFLMQNGASPLAKDCFQNLPIHYAAAQGYLDMVKLLIKHKSPYNTNGMLHLTPYRMALIGDHDAVHLFLAKKCFLIKPA